MLSGCELIDTNDCKKKDIEVKRNSVKDIFLKITMINNMQYNTHKIKLALNNQSGNGRIKYTGEYTSYQNAAKIIYPKLKRMAQVKIRQILDLIN
jgi:hypothetical protein